LRAKCSHLGLQGARDAEPPHDLAFGASCVPEFLNA
jgi:hypothetical protein